MYVNTYGLEFNSLRGNILQTFLLLNHSVPIHEEYYYKKGVEYAEHGCNVMRWRL